MQHKVSGIEALACPTSSDLTYNARVANGSKGDDPITDILIWKIPVFSPTADALIAEIWQLGGTVDLESTLNLFPRPPLAELEATLQQIRNRLWKDAKERGWEV